MSRFFGTMFLIFKNKFDAAVKSFQQWIWKIIHQNSRSFHTIQGFTMRTTEVRWGDPTFQILGVLLRPRDGYDMKGWLQQGYFSATCTNEPLLYGRFPKMVGFPPKSSILIGFSIINHPFWEYLYFRNPPIFDSVVIFSTLSSRLK